MSWYSSLGPYAPNRSSVTSENCLWLMLERKERGALTAWTLSLRFVSELLITWGQIPVYMSISNDAMSISLSE